MDKNEYIDVEYIDYEEDGNVENQNERIIRGEPLFYTTTQVASLIMVEPSTVRYWTKRFENLLNIEISNRNKQYKKSDIEKLKFIKKLAYEDNLTLQQIEDYCSTKGFDINNIEKGIIDASNPLAIQTFISAVTVEMEKKLNEFAISLLEKVEDTHKSYLNKQQDLNDKLHEDIVTTVDEVVSEKLDSKFDEKLDKLQSYIDQRELQAKERDQEIIDTLKQSMEERKRINEQLEQEKSKSWWDKIRGR
jgi:DNA-binding transcriptional MerR regulator